MLRGMLRARFPCLQATVASPSTAACKRSTRTDTAFTGRVCDVFGQQKDHHRTVHTSCAANAEHSPSTARVALVQGSSRGLGLESVRQLLERPAYKVVATCRNPDGATQLHELASQHPGRLHITQMDVTDPESIERAAKEVATVHSHLDLLFNVSAVLHIPGRMAPETALARVTAENMMLSFQTNAIGPALVCQQFAPLLNAAQHESGASEERPAVIANMSARVGSIEDNYLGGWYSYRASKSALNQLTKTMSLEFKRKRSHVACVLLHPGTCDTGLSEPFQRNVKPEKLFTRERGARQLLELIDGMTMEKTGSYLAWDGSSIKW